MNALITQTLESFRFDLPSNNVCTLQPIGNRVLEISISGSEDFDLRDMDALIMNVGKFGDNQKFKNLIVLDARIIPSYEAQVYWHSQHGSIYKLADAYLANRISQRLLDIAIEKLHTPAVPAKTFTTKEDALEWLSAIA